MVIYELRIYTCRPGSLATVLEVWEKEAQPIIERHCKMAGQWTAESGVTNRIFTLFEFRDLNHRQAAREALLIHPGFANVLARIRQHYVEQEVVFLAPTPLSPLQ